LVLERDRRVPAARADLDAHDAGAALRNLDGVPGGDDRLADERRRKRRLAHERVELARRGERVQPLVELGELLEARELRALRRELVRLERARRVLVPELRDEHPEELVLADRAVAGRARAGRAGGTESADGRGGARGERRNADHEGPTFACVSDRDA